MQNPPIGGGGIGDRRSDSAGFRASDARALSRSAATGSGADLGRTSAIRPPSGRCAAHKHKIKRTPISRANPPLPPMRRLHWPPTPCSTTWMRSRIYPLRTPIARAWRNCRVLAFNWQPRFNCHLGRSPGTAYAGCLPIQGRQGGWQRSPRDQAQPQTSSRRCHHRRTVEGSAQRSGSALSITL
jgi:hypothetical protein